MTSLHLLFLFVCFQLRRGEGVFHERHNSVPALLSLKISQQDLWPPVLILLGQVKTLDQG